VRYPVLLFLILVVSCSLPRPTSWQPERVSFIAREGMVSFRVSYPGGNFGGEGFFIAGKSFFYLEGLSPFGSTLFQGMLEDNRALLVSFLERRAYLLSLPFPGEISSYWGTILMGYLPPPWLEGALILENPKGYLLKKEIPPFRVMVSFDRAGNLKALTIKEDRTLWRLFFAPGKTRFEIPPLRVRGEMSFHTTKELFSPAKPKIVIPEGFSRLSWEIQK